MVRTRPTLVSAKLTLAPGDPADQTLIDGKWESIAAAPVGDPKFPHDFFIFTAVRVSV